MQVSRLFLHPVKSLGGFNVPQFSVDRFGPLLDRRWLVVDSRGQFITQRQKASMALVQTRLEQDRLTLARTGQPTITLTPADYCGPERKVRVWQDECAALSGPMEVDSWLSAAIGVQCQLVFMPESTRRRVDERYARHAETVSFADGFPLLLANEASLDDVNRRLSIKIGMERFRPNLVIEGAAAFAEDSWQRIRVGALEFIVAKPCSRCAIPTIDPGTAAKQPEVFKVLQQYRARDGDVYFGQNLLPVGRGQIQVGDSVEILE